MPHTQTIIEILMSHHLSVLTVIQSKSTMLRRWWLSFDLIAPLACCELQESTDGTWVAQTSSQACLQVVGPKTTEYNN